MNKLSNMILKCVLQTYFKSLDLVSGLRKYILTWVHERTTKTELTLWAIKKMAIHFQTFQLKTENLST